MTVAIYHNPRCSKSRQTLELLRARGFEPEIVEYLKTPPDAATIRALLDKLGFGSARELMRRGESAYKDLGLKDETDEEALVQAMADNPILIERPVVVAGERARLGRPPEQVLDIL